MSSGPPLQHTHKLLASMGLGMPPGRILNVGAGQVKTWRRLCRQFEKRVIVQTDAASLAGLDAQVDVEALPFASGSFAGVFCIAMLEHVRHPWATFGEMSRVLIPDGLLLAIAPWFWEYHKAPVDFWRFHASSFAVLAEDTKLSVVKTGMYQPMSTKNRKFGCWADSWGVLRKGT